MLTCIASQVDGRIQDGNMFRCLQDRLNISVILTEKTQWVGKSLNSPTLDKPRFCFDEAVIQKHHLPQREIRMWRKLPLMLMVWMMLGHFKHHMGDHLTSRRQDWDHLPRWIKAGIKNSIMGILKLQNTWKRCLIYRKIDWSHGLGQSIRESISTRQKITWVIGLKSIFIIIDNFSN